ncbi:formylmethanofuran dehydrogenase [Trinickia caryophylli]|uniref:Formylmethanofuran dehydrogenase, subunit B n=1 Tax=Trinickia caryophylli TaxID=28094 RepID=A0A1X7E2E2_TRICW|nr:formylmethanofuran dehydrogenase [Trinickia caryophylli]PMS14036.1 formylmethanofuran dehydrogenase [Trinickia caryophylli]TRX17730.1 formylmethanofuran dehydrogenase [Trinickia caryophylli]WQE11509.1 formylmethanofuran dehydrogenase [Trinickia caryophylli]SMF26055.1 formylmethanofuran dehydrogenase, subunit B [Trinickia caryophylli]GLU32673.1 tungsten-containing formylmethanofuran dehydrogenase 2 subunit B [Trinickia caryophylli]
MPHSSNDPSTAGASATPAPRTVHDWTCPFCPLLCDDLTVEVGADGTLASAGACPRLAEALATFGPGDAQAGASVDGQPATLDAALDRAAQMLGTARRPLVGGLATDVAGTRALYALAAACGATLDHLHGASLSAATRVMQDRGAFFTTLSEVRSRADLVIVFGCRPSDRYPRFYARALGGNDALARECVFLCCEQDPEAAQAVPEAATQTLLPDADPFDVIAVWSALAEGRLPQTLQTLGGGAHAMADTLAELAARVAAAQYAVLVYEPAALPGTQPALLIEGLQRIVKTINRTTRAGALALGGDDGAATANQVVTWLSGLPLPLVVPCVARTAGTGQPEHDAHRYRSARLLAQGDADALVWIATFGPLALPDTLPAGMPAIVIGHPSLGAAASARGSGTVFIPAASPAIDTDGHLFRLDGSVVAPLTAARGAPLASVAAVAARLTERLTPSRGNAQS